MSEMIKERLKSERAKATSRIVPLRESIYNGKRVPSPVMHEFAKKEDNNQIFCFNLLAISGIW